MRWASFVDIYNIYWHLFLTRFFIFPCHYGIVIFKFSEEISVEKANIAKSVRKFIYRRTIINVTGILLFDKEPLRSYVYAIWKSLLECHQQALWQVLGGDVLCERLPRSLSWDGPSRVALWHTLCDIYTPEDQYRTV